MPFTGAPTNVRYPVIVLPAKATLVVSLDVIVISCVPLNATPLIDLAVCNCVAVEALPVTAPTRLAVIVPAAKLPEPSLNTIWLAVFADAAVIVAELAWLVIVPAVAALPPILKLAAVPVNPAPLPLNCPTTVIEPEVRIDPVNW